MILRHRRWYIAKEFSICCKKTRWRLDVFWWKNDRKCASTVPFLRGLPCISFNVALHRCLVGHNVPLKTSPTPNSGHGLCSAPLSHGPMGWDRHKVEATDSKFFLCVYLTKPIKKVFRMPWPHPTGSEVIGLEIQLLTYDKIVIPWTLMYLSWTVQLFGFVSICKWS